VPQVFFSHFYTEKEKSEKLHSLTVAQTITATLRPDHLTTTHCWWLQCKFATFNTPTLRTYERYIYI